MVDEFQDTDPTQWEIVRAGVRRRRHHARADRRPEAGHLRVPRRRRPRLPGGRRARRDAGDAGPQLAQRRRTCSPPTTRCSPAPRSAIRGSGTATVRAVDAHRDRRLRHAPHAAALRMRVVHRADGRVKLTATKELAAKPSAVQEVVARRGRRHRRAAVVRRRARRPAGPPSRSPAASTPATSRCSWRRTARRLPCARRSPRSACRPSSAVTAACSRRASAPEWCSLLEAIERPSHTARVHVAAMTCFLGWSAHRVATATDDRVGGRLRAPPRVGRRAAPARRRRAARADHARRGPDGPHALARRRRAAS